MPTAYRKWAYWFLIEEQKDPSTFQKRGFKTSFEKYWGYEASLVERTTGLKPKEKRALFWEKLMDLDAEIKWANESAFDLDQVPIVRIQFYKLVDSIFEWYELESIIKYMATLPDIYCLFDVFDRNNGFQEIYYYWAVGHNYNQQICNYVRENLTTIVPEELKLIEDQPAASKFSFTAKKQAN